MHVCACIHVLACMHTCVYMCVYDACKLYVCLYGTQDNLKYCTLGIFLPPSFLGVSHWNQVLHTDSAAFLPSPASHFACVHCLTHAEHRCLTWYPHGYKHCLTHTEHRCLTTWVQAMFPMMDKRVLLSKLCLSIQILVALLRCK